LVVYMAAPAGAQPAQPKAPAATGADAQIDVSKKAQLSPADQLAESDRALAKMERAGATVRKQLEQARKDKDVVKTLCLDDKLSQIDVAVRSARERKAALQAAVSRNDAELSGHEFTILQVLRQRSEQLVAESNQCIGEEAAYLGQTKVVTTVDPAVSQTEEAPYPPSAQFPGSVTEPPSCVSCAK
jgi:hypothetical protein